MTWIMIDLLVGSRVGHESQLISTTLSSVHRSGRNESMQVVRGETCKKWGRPKTPMRKIAIIGLGISDFSAFANQPCLMRVCQASGYWFDPRWQMGGLTNWGRTGAH